jgi:hypothetical protein
MGLQRGDGDEHWVEFDTGATRLAVHHRPEDEDHPRHAEQPIALVFGSDDLTEWCEAMRRRGMHFVTAPVMEEFGVYAEAVDPDGRIVVFHEPPPPASLEEELAAAYEDDGAPQRVAIRKPLKKASTTASQMALKPVHKEKPSSARRRPSATTMEVSKVRGAWSGARAPQAQAHRRREEGARQARDRPRPQGGDSHPGEPAQRGGARQQVAAGEACVRQLRAPERRREARRGTRRGAARGGGR